ncbi:hypothetical protein FGB62_211g015 [Gracilaria domingensis]|nr:hypothetical protein FGB62_211g015 [Gracilaria domingensis]
MDGVIKARYESWMRAAGEDRWSGGAVDASEAVCGRIAAELGEKLEHGEEVKQNEKAKQVKKARTKDGRERSMATANGREQGVGSTPAVSGECYGTRGRAAAMA